MWGLEVGALPTWSGSHTVRLCLRSGRRGEGPAGSWPGMHRSVPTLWEGCLEVVSPLV